MALLSPAVYLARAVIKDGFQPSLLWALALIIALAVLFFSISLVTRRRRLTV